MAGVMAFTANGSCFGHFTANTGFTPLRLKGNLYNKLFFFTTDGYNLSNLEPSS